MPKKKIETRKDAHDAIGILNGLIKKFDNIINQAQAENLTYRQTQSLEQLRTAALREYFKTMGNFTQIYKAGNLDVDALKLRLRSKFEQVKDLAPAALLAEANKKHPPNVQEIKAQAQMLAEGAKAKVEAKAAEKAAAKALSALNEAEATSLMRASETKISAKALSAANRAEAASLIEASATAITVAAVMAKAGKINTIITDLKNNLSTSHKPISPTATEAVKTLNSTLTAASQTYQNAVSDLLKQFNSSKPTIDENQLKSSLRTVGETFKDACDKAISAVKPKLKDDIKNIDKYFFDFLKAIANAVIAVYNAIPTKLFSNSPKSFFKPAESQSEKIVTAAETALDVEAPEKGIDVKAPDNVAEEPSSDKTPGM